MALTNTVIASATLLFALLIAFPTTTAIVCIVNLTTVTLLQSFYPLLQPYINFLPHQLPTPNLTLISQNSYKQPKYSFQSKYTNRPRHSYTSTSYNRTRNPNYRSTTYSSPKATKYFPIYKSYPSSTTRIY